MPMIRALLCCFICASLSFAQKPTTLIGQGADLVDVYPIDANRVALQLGRSLVRMQFEGDRPKVTGLIRLPVDGFVFDIDGSGAVSVGATGLEHHVFRDGSSAGFAPSQVSAVRSDLFRGNSSTHPLQRDLLADSARAIVPTLSGFQVVSLSESGFRVRGQLDVVPTSEQTLGWGLGYRMSSKVTLPSVTHGDLNGDGRGDLLLRQGESMLAAFGTSTGWGPTQSWGKAPRKLDTEVIDFEQRVAPITADVNNDACADHILFDPGAGRVYFYSSRDRIAKANDRQPDQIIKVSGWILHGALFDIDGDGMKEIFLLSIPKLNLLGQLRAFKKSLLSVQLEVRKITPDGLISRSPILRKRCELPVVISLTRNRRVCNYRAFIAPVRTAAGWSLLLPGADGVGTVVQAYRGVEPVGESAEFWAPLPLEAHLTRPFAPIQLSLHDTPAVIGVLRTALRSRAELQRL